LSASTNRQEEESGHVARDQPEKSRVIDTTLIAMGATWATHDFMPVHHDRDFAQSKGAPDIFMNILTSNGLMMTYLEQWAGPKAVIKDISIKLSVPNFPRDKMDMNARITRKWQEKGENREDKIAAIGLRVSRWVTTHGISFNVEPELSHYAGIVPCGIQAHGVTSLADLGLPVSMADADVALRVAFEKVFGAVISAEPPV